MTTDEILNSLTEEQELHIIVGSNRKITVPDGLKKIAVQNDHDVNTITFDCPRYSDGRDMAEMVAYINYRLPDGQLGSYPAENMHVDEDDDSIIHFDWTIKREVTYAEGNLAILVCIKNADENGVETNHWNSDLNKDLYVSEGLECELFPVDDPRNDILTSVLLRVSTVEEENKELQERLDELANINIEAESVKSRTVLKSAKNIGWVKFATIPYIRGWRSEGALLYLNNHYVDGRFGALVYIGLNPNAGDYHDKNGIVLKQIAGEDITARIAYIKNADTKELTLYFRKDAHTVLNISSIFNNIDSLVFEPSNDTCEVLSSINPTGKAIYINAPMATKAECDSNGNNIKDTYATKEQLKDSVNFKGEIDEASLDESTAKQGDIYKLKRGGEEKQYKVCHVRWNAWSEDYGYYYVEGMYSLMTEEEETIYNECSENWDACDYRTPFNIPTDFYNTDWEYVGTVGVYYSESPVEWVFEGYAIEEKPNWLEVNTAYNLVRADGKESKSTLPTHIFEDEPDLDAADYAIFNGKSFDKFYSKEKVDNKIAEVEEDFNNKLGTWQKICDLEPTTEEVRGIEITTDKYPLISKCKELYVSVNLPKNPNGNAGTAYFWAYGENGNYVWTRIGTTTNQHSPYYCAMDLKYIGNKNWLSYSTSSQESSQSGTISNNASQSYKEIGETIQSIKLEMYDNIVFPVGITMTVWGCVSQ